MTDQDVRDFLQHMATEEPVPSFDGESLTRRARRRAARTVVVGALGVAAAIAVLFAGWSQLQESPRTPADPPEVTPVDLGIFEPVAGLMVYSDDGLWAVDPSARSPVSTLVPLEVEGTPLGWSSDGTELLLMREDPTDDTFPSDRHLYILHADGTETRVMAPPIDSSSAAAISPDGERVAYVAGTGFEDETGTLYIIAADGGQPVRIAEIVEEGGSPTFSPDGTRIAYLTGPGEHVWVANVDGTDAHEILTDQRLDMGMGRLTWSPAGDLIAMENQQEGHVAIYTFAPDGSDFTKVITGGFNHSWSPDGTQIAYGLPGIDGVSVADADGSNIRTVGFGRPGPWHPGASATTPEGEDVTPTPGPRSEAEQIFADGSLDAFAVSGSGTVLTVWSGCRGSGQSDCGFAWRLGEGSRPQATGVVYPGRAVYDSGDVFVPVAAGDGFILVPPIGEEVGVRIAPDGTASSISMACRDAGWSTPTEPGRLVWTAGFNFVDTVAGTMCPTRRFGGRPLVPGAFTPNGTLWALVDNETGPDALTIGRFDGKRWDYHDFAAPSGSWTSVLAVTDSTVVVLLANPELSPRPDRLVGFAVSTDAGATWSEVVDPDVLERDLPFSAVVSANDEDRYSGYTSMAFAGPSTLYVADGNGDLWRSIDFATFSRVSIPGGVYGLRSAGNAVIARTGDGNDLVRISADGSVEPLAVR